jgi:hypothetical protein
VRDGRPERLELERLAEHGVRGDALDHGVGAPGHQDDPQIGMVAAQLRRERPGVDGPQMEVEQQRVDPFGGQRGPCLVRRPRLDDAVSVQLEVDPAEKPDRGVVVDDENGSDACDRASLAWVASAAVSTGRTLPFPLVNG